MVLEATLQQGRYECRRGKGKNLKQCRNDTSYSEQFSKNELCRKECVTSKDRRVCILHLTQEGYDVISKIVPRNEAMIAESMEVLDQEEKEKLLYLLKKIGGKL